MMHKHSQTKYFILDPTVDHTNGGAAINAPLYVPGTGALNNLVGSGLFYNPVAGSGNHAEINAAPGSAMQFIYRRDTSTDRSPLYNRPWEQSDWINASCREGLIIDQRDAAIRSNDCTLIGDPATTINDITPQDLFNYQIQVSGHGDRSDWYNGAYNTPTIFGFYESPDFSAGVLTVPQQRDLIVAELSLDVNDNKSQQLAFAICLESAGTAAGTGAILVSVLAVTAVGTNVIIGYDRFGGTHSFVMTLEMQASFAALELDMIAKGFGAATVLMVPYVVPGTSNQPGAVIAPVAGTDNTCDMIFVMALDEGQASFDFRVNTKRRIEVGLVAGLDNVPQERILLGSEGSGYPHQLDIQYRMHNRYEETHRSRMPYNSYYLEFQNALRTNAFYDYFVIEHCDGRTATSGMPSQNKFTTIIAVVNTTIGDATSNPFFTGNPGAATALAQRAYIVASLNAFDTANGTNAIVNTPLV
jgi:hypothetical protein